MNDVKLPNEKELIKTMRRNQIDFAALFGSRAKGTATDKSDYDILIEFSPDARVGLFKYQNIEDEITLTIGQKVDLVTMGGIDKHIKGEVLNSMRVIYDNRAKG